MRNFTGSQEFDDTLPTGEGSLEAGLSIEPERLAAAMREWVTKRGKGNGKPENPNSNDGGRAEVSRRMIGALQRSSPEEFGSSPKLGRRLAGMVSRRFGAAQQSRCV